MATKKKAVLIKLDEIEWSNFIQVTGGGPDSTPSVSPYLWTLFFTIDGSTVQLAETGFLSGNVAVYPTSGGHGDLGIWSMSPAEKVGIPDALGFWSTQLLPIPIDPSVEPWLKAFNVRDPESIFGFVALLLNDGGHIPPHAVEAGRAALVEGFRTFVDGQLRDSLGVQQSGISPQAIDNAREEIKKQIRNAIWDSMSWADQAWALSGLDGLIATWVKIFDGGQSSVSIDSPVPTQKFGTWTLRGDVTITESCPAEAFSAAIREGQRRRRRNDFKLSRLAKRVQAGMNSMRRYRDDGGLARNPGLVSWWREARVHTPELMFVLARHHRLREAATLLLGDMHELLKRPGRTIPSAYLKEAKVLFAGLRRVGSARLKASATRILAVLPQLNGLTADDALQALSRIHAARDRNAPAAHRQDLR